MTLIVKNSKELEALVLQGATDIKFDLPTIYKGDKNRKLAEIRILAAFLKSNPKLTSLKISGNFLDADCAKELAEALQINNTLVNLDLSGNDFGNEGSKFIFEALKDNKSIKNLDISSNKISDDCSDAIEEALLINKSITNFSISHNNFNSGFAKSLGIVLANNNTLKLIQAESSRINDPEGLIGAGLSQNQSLTHLLLKYNHLANGNGAKAIFKALDNNGALKTLDVASNQLNDFIFENDHSSITTLNLNSNNLSLNTAQIHNILRHNQNLEIVYLSNNTIDDEGLEIIAAALEENIFLNIELDNSNAKIAELNKRNSSVKDAVKYYAQIALGGKLARCLDEDSLKKVFTSDKLTDFLLEITKKHLLSTKSKEEIVEFSNQYNAYLYRIRDIQNDRTIQRDQKEIKFDNATKTYRVNEDRDYNKFSWPSPFFNQQKEITVPQEITGQEDWKIEVITNLQEVNELANHFKHCMKGVYERCLTGESQILLIKKNNVKMSAVEININVQNKSLAEEHGTDPIIMWHHLGQIMPEKAMQLKIIEKWFLPKVREGVMFDFDYLLKQRIAQNHIRSQIISDLKIDPFDDTKYHYIISLLANIMPRGMQENIRNLLNIVELDLQEFGLGHIRLPASPEPLSTHFIPLAEAKAPGYRIVEFDGFSYVQLDKTGVETVAKKYYDKHNITIQAYENIVHGDNSAPEKFREYLDEEIKKLSPNQTTGIVKLTYASSQEEFLHSKPFIIAKSANGLATIVAFDQSSYAQLQSIYGYHQSKLNIKIATNYEKMQNDSVSCTSFSVNTLKNCLIDQEYIGRVLNPECADVNISKLTLGQSSKYFLSFPEEKRQKYVRNDRNLKALEVGHKYATWINEQHLQLLADEYPKTFTVIDDIERTRAEIIKQNGQACSAQPIKHTGYFRLSATAEHGNEIPNRT